MVGQSRRWMILVATIWIQASTGTNFDFSAYSSELKSVLNISQVQLNYLATASDLGKAIGWSSGLALLYLPLWAVLFIAAFMGLVGYGFQWLVIQHIIFLPYILVFLCCLLAGLSITWFNTVCFVLCIKNFPTNRALALALTVAFNGVSPALYTLLANTFSSSNDTLYLSLNAIVPLVTSFAALIPILRQPPIESLSVDAVRRDSVIFITLNILAVFTGLYVLFLNNSTVVKTARLLFGGAILLLVLPLAIPGITYARQWANQKFYSRFRLDGSSFNLVEVDDLQLLKGLLSRENSYTVNGNVNVNGYENSHDNANGNGNVNVTYKGDSWCCEEVMEKNRLSILGEEHSAKMLVRRLDFWLYYIAYICGGTIGLVYSNNLGQIAQSLGDGSRTATLITVYSSCSFFGRLLSAIPDLIRGKVYFARTGWLAIALLPTPIAFFVLALVNSSMALEAGTALIGLSSGFIFAAAVSITSELFGPNSMGVNHNILVTNIPIGSLLYGFLAATVYDSNAGVSSRIPSIVNESIVCMGRKCYLVTFVAWGFISLFGLASSVLLFLRTKAAYERFEQNRILSQVIS